jgi:FtsH-binding integral membrane protein
MVTSARLASRFIGVRAFSSRQLLLVLVAAALFAVLWVANVRGPGMGLVPMILYSLFIGNLTTPIMNRLSPLSSRLRFP